MELKNRYRERLLHLGQGIFNIMSDQMEDIGMDRYYYALTLFVAMMGELTQGACREAG